MPKNTMNCWKLDDVSIPEDNENFKCYPEKYIEKHR